MPSMQLKTKEQRLKRTIMIADLHGQGLTLKEIAAKVGCSPGTVDYYIHKNKPTKEKENTTNGKLETSKKLLEGTPAILDVNIAYATGRVEQFIRGYAESLNLPFTDVARRVAKGLSTITGR